MSERNEPDSNIVLFPNIRRKRVDDINSDNNLTRRLPSNLYDGGGYELNADRDQALNIVEDLEFSRIFGFSLNGRGRAAVRNIMRVYDLSIYDVRKFRSAGYLRWDGREIHLQVCVFSIIYGLLCCSVFALNCIFLLIWLFMSNYFERSYLVPIFALFSLSSALLAWSYVMFLKPFWELRRIRATTRWWG